MEQTVPLKGAPALSALRRTRRISPFQEGARDRRDDLPRTLGTNPDLGDALDSLPLHYRISSFIRLMKPCIGAPLGGDNPPSPPREGVA